MRATQSKTKQSKAIRASERIHKKWFCHASCMIYASDRMGNGFCEKKQVSDGEMRRRKREKKKESEGLGDAACRLGEVVVIGRGRRRWIA